MALQSGTTFVIDQVDVTAPVVTVDTLYAATDSPELSGTVDDNTASVDLTVNSLPYTATVNADNTWNLSAGTISPGLAEGTYDVIAVATDAFGNVGTDSTTNELVVDLTTPVVAVDTLVTTDPTPALSGTVDDNEASVTIQIDTVIYQATNLGDGTWSIPDSTVAELAEGIYDLLASATDKAGNVGVDTTTNELTIDFGAPSISFDTLSTIDRSPLLTGTVDDSLAVVKLTLLDSTYEATNNKDGTWQIAEGTIVPLSVGLYDVAISATDVANNLAQDTTFNGLSILPATPVASPGAEVTVSSFVASWTDVGSDVSSYFLDVANDSEFTALVEGYDGLELSDTTTTVSGLDYSRTYHYRVKAVFGSGDISDYSETVAVTTLTDPGTQADSLALVSIFDALGGDEWKANDNWLVGRLQDWYGIEFEEARVRSIALDTNNLVGVLPEIADALDQVTAFSLKGNDLTDLTDISGMAALAILDVSENRLQFGTLERVTAQVDSVDYTNQNEVLERMRTLQEVGTTYTVKREVSGTANSYSWFRDEAPIVNEGDSLQVTIASTEDEGVFYAEVRNDNVPGLVLTTTPVLLRVSSLERDKNALLAIYEAMGGAEWSNGADWPNQEDILQWQGVGVTDNRVSSLNLASAGLTGALPDDILDIPGLLSLDLSGNAITELPDLTSLENLANPDVSSNQLQFDDLEPNVKITGIRYENQATFGPEGVSVKLPKGSNYRFAAPVGGEANTYRWIFNGEEQSDAVVDTTRSSYIINDINYDNQGEYVLEVRNTEVPDLTLTSLPQSAFATVDIDFIPIYSDIDLEAAALDEGDAYLLKVVPGRRFDSTQQVAIDASGLTFPEVVLGDYLIAIRTDSLILKDKDGRVDSVKLLPTYYRSTFLWEEADTLVLRGEIDGDSLFMQQRPRPLTPDDGDGEVGLFVQSNFADVNGPNGKVQARRTVKRAGCSLRRRRRATGGRTENDEFELVAYKETDDDGRVTFNNLPDGTYRLNIEYPGIPMDTTSFLEFEIGAGGMEENSLTLEATVAEEGIAVELVEALGILRKYFKELKVYPNPADKFITVAYRKLVSSGVKVQLLTISGQVLLEQEVDQGLNRQMRLDVEGVEEGLYLLRFFDHTSQGDSILTYRVIIRR